MDRTYLVGEFAGRTGVTVRALHHYDRIGLLRPARRAENGYRYYTDADVARLQQIVTLKAIGFELEAIAAIVDAPGFDPRSALCSQIRLLETKRQAIDQALRALRNAERLATDEGSPDWETLIRIIEASLAMDDIDYAKYFSPEQLRDLRAREFGAQDQAEVSQRWQALLTDIAAARDESPASPAAQRLVERWDSLVAEFTQGDAGLERSLRATYRDPENRAYAERAMPGLAQAGKFIERARAAR